MNISIIGANSFIGKNFLNLFLNNSEIPCSKIILTSRKNFNYKEFLFKESSSINIEQHKLDLNDNNFNSKIFDNIDVLILLAGFSKPSKMTYDDMYRINVLGVKKILQNCLQKKVKKIIVLSSAESLGVNLTKYPFDENQSCNPVTNYGKVKFEIEKICKFFVIKKKLNINLIRPVTIYGNFDKEFIKFFKLNIFKFFPIRSSVKCIEYVHVNDLFSAVSKIILYADSGEIYNLSSEKKYSLNQILRFIEKSTNIKFFNFFLPHSLMRIFFPRTVDRLTNFYFNLSLKKIKSINYQESKSFDSSIKELYEHFKNNKNKYL